MARFRCDCGQMFEVADADLTGGLVRCPACLRVKKTVELATISDVPTGVPVDAAGAASAAGTAGAGSAAGVAGVTANVVPVGVVAGGPRPGPAVSAFVTVGGTNSHAIAGFIFGLLSLLLICFAPLAMIFGLLGVVMSLLGLRAKARAKGGAGLAVTGLVLALVAMIVVAAFLVSIYSVVRTEL